MERVKTRVRLRQQHLRFFLHWGAAVISNIPVRKTQARESVPLKKSLLLPTSDIGRVSKTILSTSN